jgi:outer membrane protein OmpA-like peptidoglycan-associated protein
MRNYQRGVLLGLTLAEVFILLIFVFLLCLQNNREPTQGGSLSDSITNIGVAPNEKSSASDDTFPIPDTPRTLIMHGVPVEPPPILGIDKTKSEATKSKADAPEKNVEVVDQRYDEQNDLKSSQEKQSSEIGHNWPPIITITEAEGYSFPTGSAVLSASFEELLKTKIASVLKDNVSKFNANIIEVFGHTDEQPKSGQSNLDSSLIRAANGQVPILSLQSADNVGLGMARAVAVVQVLEACPELDASTILPYSAGQTINTSGKLSPGISGDDQSRRRIEIRLRGTR